MIFIDASMQVDIIFWIYYNPMLGTSMTLSHNLLTKESHAPCEESLETGCLPAL